MMRIKSMRSVNKNSECWREGVSEAGGGGSIESRAALPKQTGNKSTAQSHGSVQ
jgi:hypothetical protein